LARHGELLESLAALKEEFKAVDTLDLVHGKDAVRILEHAIGKFGIREDEGCRMLWCSFEREFALASKNLSSLLKFLRSA
jgi:hypothetical protein